MRRIFDFIERNWALLIIGSLCAAIPVGILMWFQYEPEQSSIIEPSNPTTVIFFFFWSICFAIIDYKTTIEDIKADYYGSAESETQILILIRNRQVTAIAKAVLSFLAAFGITLGSTWIISKYHKSAVGEITQHQLLSPEAYEAFSASTINMDKLTGDWEVKWTVFDEKTKKETPYGAETISLKVQGAEILCQASDKQRQAIYWLRGRVATSQRITLLYWSRPEPLKSDLAGVVFLTISEINADPSKIYLDGNWLGYIKSGSNYHNARGSVLWYRHEDKVHFDEIHAPMK